MTTIYPARRVVTLDQARPSAEAVAVRGDRVLAVGSLAELAAFRGATVDDRYRDDVLFPGFVEAHAHAESATVWRNRYVGYFERRDPRGVTWPGSTSIATVVERLRVAERELTDPDEVLFAWGFDPIYLGSDRLLAADLDRVSTTRPIYVHHANGHVASVNSALITRDGIHRGLTVEGLGRDASGQPNGELKEHAAMSLATSASIRTRAPLDVGGLLEFGTEASRAGVTTITDLASTALLTDAGIGMYREVTGSTAFSARLVPFHFGAFPTPGLTVDEAAKRLVDLRDSSTAKLSLGGVKLMLDGSIQAFTARLAEPGYLNHEPNGIWVVPPAQFEAAFEVFHRAGLLVHVHVNGDEATEVMLDVVERVLARHPRFDHRHTVTHSQLSTAAQYRRMAALGLGANLFANHTWYWGDQHRDITVGPDRAGRMNAAATALRAGVPISLHSDTPVTPLDPLATASYAIERRTASGAVLGANEAITLDQALRAVTIGAAFLLKRDGAVGSIEGGKFADFAVLDRDPYAVATAAELREITVLGTVVGGAHYPADPLLR
ncbi:amidohydrolase [soil metagenome]